MASNDGATPTVADEGEGTGCCRVLGCNRDMASERRYYQRHMICEAHLKSLCLVVDGEQMRFCQQCARLHNLTEFQGDQRSCRVRLKHRNKRRLLLKQQRREEAARQAAAQQNPHQPRSQHPPARGLGPRHQPPSSEDEDEDGERSPGPPLSGAAAGAGSDAAAGDGSDPALSDRSRQPSAPRGVARPLNTGDTAAYVAGTGRGGVGPNRGAHGSADSAVRLHPGGAPQLAALQRKRSAPSSLLDPGSGEGQPHAMRRPAGPLSGPEAASGGGGGSLRSAAAGMGSGSASGHDGASFLAQLDTWLQREAGVGVGGAAADAQYEAAADAAAAAAAGAAAGGAGYGGRAGGGGSSLLPLRHLEHPRQAAAAADGGGGGVLLADMARRRPSQGYTPQLQPLGPGPGPGPGPGAQGLHRADSSSPMAVGGSPPSYGVAPQPGGSPLPPGQGPSSGPHGMSHGQGHGVGASVGMDPLGRPFLSVPPLPHRPPELDMDYEGEGPGGPGLGPGSAHEAHEALVLQQQLRMLQQHRELEARRVRALEAQRRESLLEAEHQRVLASREREVREQLLRRSNTGLAAAATPHGIGMGVGMGGMGNGGGSSGGHPAAGMDPHFGRTSAGLLLMRSGAEEPDRMLELIREEIEGRAPLGGQRHTAPPPQHLYERAPPAPATGRYLGPPEPAPDWHEPVGRLQHPSHSPHLQPYPHHHHSQPQPQSYHHHHPQQQQHQYDHQYDHPQYDHPQYDHPQYDHPHHQQQHQHSSHQQQLRQHSGGWAHDSPSPPPPQLAQRQLSAGWEPQHAASYHPAHSGGRGSYGTDGPEPQPLSRTYPAHNGHRASEHYGGEAEYGRALTAPELGMEWERQGQRQGHEQRYAWEARQQAQAESYRGQGWDGYGGGVGGESPPE
ncbi:hypothetical protein HYH03_008730 [Edaphochlamys debaryana]|uniref:SBP-type domain-containing protein n=1 Tax=Edaphochlamys debaryana TaxID=47281 RepID=A0A835XXT0_9CHLO|nr:hypothetical protein HYH03_008730 [Edaphochlamys debaryana]|eukprot:KAG2493067.1 hypothetical protein HYH03_008730 [Edaphochlamys debaryana]